MKDKYQESLNDIIRNCKGFPCKNDSFYNIQELINLVFSGELENCIKDCTELLENEIKLKAISSYTLNELVEGIITGKLKIEVIKNG